MRFSIKTIDSVIVEAIRKFIPEFVSGDMISTEMMFGPGRIPGLRGLMVALFKSGRLRHFDGDNFGEDICFDGTDMHDDPARIGTPIVPLTLRLVYLIHSTELARMVASRLESQARITDIARRFTVEPPTIRITANLLEIILDVSDFEKAHDALLSFGHEDISLALLSNLSIGSLLGMPERGEFGFTLTIKVSTSPTIDFASPKLIAVIEDLNQILHIQDTLRHMLEGQLGRDLYVGHHLLIEVNAC